MLLKIGRLNKLNLPTIGGNILGKVCGLGPAGFPASYTKTSPF